MIKLFKGIDGFFSSIKVRFWIGAGFITLMMIYALMNQNYIMGWPSPDVNLSVVDADVWIRLTKVRELIQTGNLHNHLVTATNAPIGGIETPWTRPVDFILVFLYQFTPTDFSIEKRLLIVANWYPVIIETLIFFFLIKAAETGFKSVKKIWVIILYLIGSLINSQTHSYFMIGNVDHHSIQALLWIIAVWIILDKPTPIKSSVLGFIIGLWFWISPESMPFIAVIFSILALRSIYKPDFLKQALLTSLGLTLTTTLALFVEHPATTLLTSPHYDTVSIVYAVLFALCSLEFIILHYAIPRLQTIKQRFILCGATGISLLVFFIALFPKFLKGPMADVDPYILTNFLPNISEATPLLKAGACVYISVLYLPLLALFLSIRLWRKNPILLILLLTPLSMIFFQLRWSFYVEAISIIVIAKLLPSSVIAMRRKYKKHEILVNAFIPIIVLHIIAFSAISILPPPKIELPDDVANCNAYGFQSIQSGSLVKALGNKPITIESNILGNSGISFFTPYHYIAGYYHREGVGLKIKDSIFNAKSLNDVRPLLKERNVKALYICPFSGELWPDSYFSNQPVPRYDWVTINHNLNIQNKGTGTVKPILLNIEP